MTKEYSADEACDILAKVYNLKYIQGIRELPDKYLLAPLDDDGKVMILGCVCAFDKRTGKMTTFFPPDHKQELSKAKRIEVPERYRFKG